MAYLSRVLLLALMPLACLDNDLEPLAPDICGWNVLEPVQIRGLGARSDTTERMAIYEYGIGDCSTPWEFSCENNDMVISCGDHIEHWSILYALGKGFAVQYSEIEPGGGDSQRLYIEH